jgi:hypothetical protein
VRELEHAMLMDGACEGLRLVAVPITQRIDQKLERR